MSRTLTLIDAAWVSARDLAATGLRTDARRLLETLLARPDLPTGTAAKAHRLAAALHLNADRYTTARRHLSAAARLEPGNADTRYQLGVAFEDDPHGCDERAARQFRRAIKLDSDNATYWAAYGRAAVRVGKDKSGLRSVRKAVALAPTDPTVLAVAVEALRVAGRARSAWKVMCRACFLDPADGALRRLWQRVKFDLACARQPKPRAADVTPSVLPFVRVVSPCGATRVVRRDAGSRPAAHLGRLKVRG